MDIEDALITIDKTIHPENLTTLQELIFRECWTGKTYQQIAHTHDYDSNYIRSIGSRLWQLLSEVYHEEITKNNFRSILRQKFRSNFQQSDRFTGEFPDGTIPINSFFYIERPPLETEFQQEIAYPGSFIRIQAAPKMGKTSLLNRILNLLDAEYYAIKIDLQQADIKILGNLNKLIRWLLANVCCQLKIKNSLDSYWDKDLGIKMSCTTYLEKYILAFIDKPLILAIDRLDVTFEHIDVADEFLSLLYFWHEKAKDNSVWQKLRIVTVHSTESCVSSQSYQSLFNLGIPLTLRKFNQQQVLDLADRYQLNFQNVFQENNLQNLSNLIDGHPYLIRLALYHLAKYDLDLTKLIAEATTETSIFIDLLHYYLKTLYENIYLAKAFKQVVMSEKPIQLESFVAYQLDNLGLISLQGNNVTPSCELYRLYFKDRLCQF
jgi:hypothetical protein